MCEIGSLRLDDTPFNGQTERGITSNWAYDEDVTLRALIEATLPWIIDIDFFPTPKSHVNWNTYQQDPAQAYGGWNRSAITIDSEIAWDVLLAAGTWDVEICYLKDSTFGIFSVQFDSVEKGTVDSYAATTAYNGRTLITGIVVPLTKKIEFKLKITDKNTSSTGYYAYLSHVNFRRTS